MYNLRLTPEQHEFRDTVRDFVEREIKPVVLHPERLQKLVKPLPLELIDQASQMGLCGLALSEARGGAGADNLTACIVAEELAAGDVGIAVTLAETARLARLLFDEMMNDAQRETFLPAFVADDRFHLAFAAHTTDPDLAWKYHREISEAPSPRVTAARQTNGDYILNGATAFVQNAPIARLIAVQAAVVNSGEAVSLLLPAGSAGMSINDLATNSQAVKWFHGAGGEITFMDCRVPATHVLGNGGAATLAANAAGRGNPLMQAINIGVARAALEAAVTYAKLRVQGGRTIVQHQGIGNILADAAIKIEVARNTVWQAAWASDHPEAVADRSVSGLPLQTVARVFTAEAMYTSTEEAAECFGAMGVMLDMPLAKYVNEARVFLHSGESNSVAKLRVAEAVAGFVRAASPRAQV
ncbi:MAG: acyl-CoA dehydrogenase [Betaproteobacteria bacterium]|nr:acyl-CoA dehydrogenase [Betaproteobacteria bacterium]